ncbi:MAG: SDR family NAD(P)-dependent oxidoreductase [Paludibacteraceae bacterium]|nr:SDR family NAD(P)-dependent oxidoreductase [Paludibacteraceae bacterium]
MSQTAIVMGATSGMGLRVAQLLLERGWTVGAAGRRLNELQQLQDRYPDRVKIQVIDVTAADAPQRLQELIGQLGTVDLYFHSSGYGSQNCDLKEDIELKTLETNGTGFVRMVGAAYRYFRDECGGKGHIAAISSVAGTKGLGAAPSYSATKRMQNTYLQCLAQQAHFNKLDIRFTDIRPGFVETAFLGGDNYPLLMSPDYAAAKIVKAVLARKRKVVIDWRYRLLVWLWQLIPDFVWERLNIR